MGALLPSQIILMVYDTHTLSLVFVLQTVETLAALLHLVVILCMPLRDPELPANDISPAVGTPNHLFRSPEDNLTLWQFMSVTWMAPLISIGYKRQLNDEDVWSLSYEFQHQILHETFRELSGSVVRRLLSANGLDLAILSCLGVLESLSSTFHVDSQRLFFPLTTFQTLPDPYCCNSFFEPWKTYVHHKARQSLSRCYR